MTARQKLYAYIGELHRRLRVRTFLRGAALVTLVALVTTVALVVATNALAFSRASLTSARIILCMVMAACVAFACVLPLWRLDRRRSAWEAEAVVPEFAQRLITLAEHRRDEEEPFVELLAADTLRIARQAEIVQVVPNKKLLIWLGTALASLGVLIWIILAAPGYLGYGAALLWAGQAGAAPLYDLRVTPGDATVRRNADQLIGVEPRGLQTNAVRLYARYESALKWDQLPMQPQPGTSNFQFLFAGLPEGVEYYVEAGPLRSRHFHLRVVDVAAVKQIRVTYHFPAWTGMPPAVEDHGGDLRAVEGTEADLEILTDHPLRDGVLVLDDGKQIPLSGGVDNPYKGTVRLDRDGAYHIAALDRGEPVRVSEDFFIEATKAEPPDVVISRPEGDYRATPIEEVTVAARANDPFGLRDFRLHYSVNGGAEQTVNLLPDEGRKAADGSTVIRLEDFKVVPGDIVSLYATARDAHTESRTDLFFIQAEPFEREYSQSQQAGGAGGAGANAPDEISQRQKEIIGATWKQLGDKGSSVESAGQNAKFLSGVQSKLHDQAVSLANRLQMRDLVAENDEFVAFQKNMRAAADAMTPASEKLRGQNWNAAIPQEQRALQYLLRAETTFRQIQVAFASGGANSGGAGSAGRDLASLFDLELDTQKNQYETAQTAESARERSEDIDEALRKLDELASRQERLASQNDTNLPEQRWQQEMLRREVEQLQRQLEQLTRNGQPSPDSRNGPSSSGQPASSGGASDARVQQALNQLRQANEAMRRGFSQGQDHVNTRRTAELLREARNLLGNTQRQQNSGRLDALAQEADRLADEQRTQSDRIRDLTRPYGAGAREDSARDTPQALSEDRQRLAGDLAHLESRLREAVRDLALSDRSAASKLRDALRQVDQSNLDSRVQRSADMLRRGMNPDQNGSEAQIGSDLQTLGQQTRDAQQVLGSGSPLQDSQSALDQVQSLRNRLEALDRSSRDRNNAGGGQAGPGNRNGQVGTFVNPGGASNGPVYGGMNTGNNNYGSLPSSPSRDAYPVLEPAYRDSVAQLNRLRGMVKDDPESLRQVQELIREMQRLDPSRFLGNPAMVEELRDQVLGDLDKLELQLRSASDRKQSGLVHSADSQPVPAGYEDAVADYFRRLSKTP